jgi:hypothetical protein
MPNEPRHWPHDTHEKLHAAGYRLDKGPTGEGNGIKPCKYPPCEQRVIFYITPNGKDMPFEEVARAENTPEGLHAWKELQPHAATCVGYAKREADRKAEKAAAKK